MKSRERKSSQKAYKILQFRQGWVGERCEAQKLLGDSGEPESGQKGYELQCFRKEKGSVRQPRGVDQGSRKGYLNAYK